MAVKIRLARHGAKKAPYYRIIVTDSRNKRDGRFIEKIGTFNPLLEDNTKRVTLDNERATYWLSVGAQASDRVQRFLFEAGLVKEQPIKKTNNLGVSKKDAKKQAEEVKAAAVQAANDKKAAAKVAEAEAAAAEASSTEAAA